MPIYVTEWLWQTGPLARLCLFSGSCTLIWNSVGIPSCSQIRRLFHIHVKPDQTTLTREHSLHHKYHQVVRLFQSNKCFDQLLGERSDQKLVKIHNNFWPAYKSNGQKNVKILSKIFRLIREKMSEWEKTVTEMVTDSLEWFKYLYCMRMTKISILVINKNMRPCLSLIVYFWNRLTLNLGAWIS